MSNHSDAERSIESAERDIPRLAGAWSWSRLLEGPLRSAFESSVLRRIASRRWFGGKARTLASVQLVDLYQPANDLCVALVEIHFADGGRDAYQLPLAISPRRPRQEETPQGDLLEWMEVRAGAPPVELVLHDALATPGGCQAMLSAFRGGGTTSSAGHTVTLEPGPDYALVSAADGELEPRASQAEQSNSSVRYGDRLILKLYRRLEPGIQPDWEVNRHLAGQGFAHIPPLIGALAYRTGAEPAWTLALLQGFANNFGDGWSYMLERLSGLLDRALESPAADAPLELPDFFEASRRETPLAVEQFLGETLGDARLLGERTAQMHVALARAGGDRAFQPERLSSERRSGSLKRALDMAEQTLRQLSDARPQLPPTTAEAAEVLLRSREQLEFMLREVVETSVRALAIRIHGDYHLGQVLMTERGPLVIDFEGEPARPLAQRRDKDLALRDVAGMIRSFHYASSAVAAEVRESHPADQAPQADRWARAWYAWASVNFMAAYRQAARGAEFFSADEHELRALLNACLLEKAIYELRYELNNRPGWIHLPLAALVDVVAGSGLV